MNWQYYQHQLQTITDQQQVYKSIKVKKKHLEKQRSLLTLDIERLYEQLKETEQLVSELKHPSFMNKMKNKLSRNSQQLADQQQVYQYRQQKLIHQKQQYDEIERQLAKIDSELTIYEQRNFTKQREEIKELMRNWLQHYAPKQAKQLNEIESQHTSLQQFYIQCQQTVELGEKIIFSLHEMKVQLFEAGEIAVKEMFGLSHYKTNNKKHDHLMNFENELGELQENMKEFWQQFALIETKKVNLHPLENVLMSNKAKAFDNVFLAFKLQKNIEKADEYIHELLQIIEESVAKAKHLFHQSESQRKQLFQQSEHFYLKQEQALFL